MNHYCPASDSPTNHFWELKDKTIIDEYVYELKFSETFVCKNCGAIKKIITSNKNRRHKIEEYYYD